MATNTTTLKFHRQNKKLQQILSALIATKRKAPPNHDLLSLLLQTRDNKGKQLLKEQRIIAELITFFTLALSQLLMLYSGSGIT